MLKLSQSTLGLLEQDATQRFDNQCAKRLAALYPEHFSALCVGMPELVCLVAHVRKSVDPFGITGQRDVTRLCIAAVSLGADFVSDPRFSYGIASSLRVDDLPSSARVVRFLDFVDWWLVMVWAESEMSDMANRFDAILQHPDLATADVENMRHVVNLVLPEQWTVLNEEKLEAFLDTCIEECRRLDWMQTRRVNLYCACASLHGALWPSDPQCAELKEIFESGLTEERLTAFYRRFA